MLFTQGHTVSKWPILDTTPDLFDIRTHHLIFSFLLPLHYIVLFTFVHVVGDKM